jgi:hypothetical protein
MMLINDAITFTIVNLALLVVSLLYFRIQGRKIIDCMREREEKYLKGSDKNVMTFMGVF